VGFLVNEHPHDITLLHDQIFNAVDLDLGTRLLSQDPIARFDVNWDELAGFVAPAWTYRNGFALLRLLFGGVRNDDAACGLFRGVDALDHNSIMKWTEFHGCPP
jgi:hypothetical protein